jgi:hypothetical protein
MINGSTGTNASWKIYRFPTTEEQVLRHDQVAWRVDANIGSTGFNNVSLGLSDVTSYTGMTNGTLVLTNNTGAGVISAQIPCSGTNPPTGTTCAAGDESVGVSFDLPAAGEVVACVSFSHFIQTGASGSLVTTFQIVETPNNAQNILQEGKSRISGINGNQNTTIGLPFRVCGNFSFTSAGQKTLRLMYEQDVTATVINNLVLTDQETIYGQRDIHWEVYPRNTYQPAPLLVGSVISQSSGITRTEAVFFAGNVNATANCTSSPCAIVTNPTGGVSSVTRTGTGKYRLNFSPPFSATPVCTCSSVQIGVGYRICAQSLEGGASTLVEIDPAVDVGASVTCIGPR